MLHDLTKLNPIQHSSGYMRAHYPSHPHSSAKGYVLYHRIIMENILERYLSPQEVVHHVDGNIRNNSEDNLLLFGTKGLHTQHHCRKDWPVSQCPVCKKLFAQTKNKKKHCSHNCSRKSRTGVSTPKKTVQEKPTPEQLAEMVWKVPSSQIAKTYGVSDRMVGKWCKKYNIQKPPRGYWSRKSKTGCVV